MIVGYYFLFVIYCTRFLYFGRCAAHFKRNIAAIDTNDIFTGTSRIHIVHARTALSSTSLFKCDQIAIINIRNNNKFQMQTFHKEQLNMTLYFVPYTVSTICILIVQIENALEYIQLALYA